LFIKGKSVRKIKSSKKRKRATRQSQVEPTLMWNLVANFGVARIDVPPRGWRRRGGGWRRRRTRNLKRGGLVS